MKILATMAQSIKIFAPLGTQKFPFNRLVGALNSLIDQKLYAPEEIVMQSSIYDLKPKFTAFELIDAERFHKFMQEAELVITHGGVNSIISCMNLHKPFIIAPRLKQYGEHVDDHQLEIAQLMKENLNAVVIQDFSQLQQAIIEAKSTSYCPWVSKRPQLIKALSKTITTFMESN